MLTYVRMVFSPSDRFIDRRRTTGVQGNPLIEVPQSVWRKQTNGAREHRVTDIEAIHGKRANIVSAVVLAKGAARSVGTRR